MSLLWWFYDLGWTGFALAVLAVWTAISVPFVVIGRWIDSQIRRQTTLAMDQAVAIANQPKGAGIATWTADDMDILEGRKAL